MVMKFDFETEMSRDGLSTMKWEYEIDRTGFSDILSYGTADMDYPSPEPICRAICKVAEKGHLGYPYVKESYYKAIESWLLRTTGWRIDARRSVSNHVGIYTSVWNVIQSMTREGDEIIIQTPVHFCFSSMIRDNHRTVVENPLKNVNGKYEIDFEHLESCFSKKTKLLWICNPHNPVGRAWDREELLQIGELCLKHNVRILSDDVYCGLLYPGISYIPIASLSKEISDITITCYSTSKTYNTTGIKFSYVVIENLDLMVLYEGALRQLDLNYGINLMGLAVTEAAYNECDEWVRCLMEHVQNNEKVLKGFLEYEIPEVSLIESEATYFAWLDCRKVTESSDKLADLLEQKAHIILESGEHLGTGGNGYIRINLACPRTTLMRGMERVKKMIL